MLLAIRGIVVEATTSTHRKLATNQTDGQTDRQIGAATRTATILLILLLYRIVYTTIRPNLEQRAKLKRKRLVLCQLATIIYDHHYYAIGKLARQTRQARQATQLFCACACVCVNIVLGILCLCARARERLLADISTRYNMCKYTHGICICIRIRIVVYIYRIG